MSARRAAPSKLSVPSGDRLRLAADEGATLRARRAAPSKLSVPSGDRLRLAADEGQQ